MWVRIKIERNFLKSQWSSFSTSATPQLYWRPLTMRPSDVLTSFSDPMTANGIAAMRERACWAAASSSSSTGGV